MELRSRFKSFVDWLQTSGAEIVPLASDWEVIRYTAWDSSQQATAKRPHTHVIYRKADGRITFTGASFTHWNLFTAGKPLLNQDRVIGPAPPRKRTKSWSKRTRLLLHERDGDLCCICNDPLTHMNTDHLRGGETIEHWQARFLGGTDHIDNLKLAHAKCNRDVGHKTVEEKQAIAAMYKAGLVSKVAHWSVSPRPRKRSV